MGVYYRKGINGRWMLSNGRLRQISVGSKGRVFGTARNNTIWTKVGLKGKWQNIPGRMKWIATNNRNQVTGCNRSNMIFFALSKRGYKAVRKFSRRAIYHPKKTHKLRKIRRFSVKKAKKLMKKKVSKRIVKRMKRKVPKRIIKRAKRIAKKKVTKRAIRKPLRHTSRKWFVNSRFGSWTGYKGWAAIGGRLRQVAIGKNGVQWGVATNDTIWTRTTGGWRHVGGRL